MLEQQEREGGKKFDVECEDNALPLSWLLIEIIRFFGPRVRNEGGQITSLASFTSDIELDLEEPIGTVFNREKTDVVVAIVKSQQDSAERISQVMDTTWREILFFLRKDPNNAKKIGRFLMSIQIICELLIPCNLPSIEDIFTEFDQDGSGTIDFRELSKGLERCGPELTDPSLLHCYDIDRLHLYGKARLQLVATTGCCAAPST